MPKETRRHGVVRSVRGQQRHFVGEPAVAHVEHASGPACHFGRVRGQQDGDPQLAIELGHQRQHPRAVVGIEVAGGLVGDEQGRLVHERARDGRALHLAAGHFLWVVPQAMGDADALGQARGAAGGLAHGHPAQQARQRDVVAERQRRQQVEELEDEANALPPDAGELVVGEAFERAALERQLAGGGPIHRATEVQQCRFAATRRAHQGHEIAAVDGESDSVERADRGAATGVGPGQLGRDEEGHAYMV